MSSAYHQRQEYLEYARKLAQAKKEAAEEFLRLAALAGPKANTYMIQRQVDAEYIVRITELEALLEYIRLEILEAINAD